MSVIQFEPFRRRESQRCARELLATAATLEAPGELVAARVLDTNGEVLLLNPRLDDVERKIAAAACAIQGADAAVTFAEVKAIGDRCATDPRGLAATVDQELLGLDA